MTESNKYIPFHFSSDQFHSRCRKSSEYNVSILQSFPCGLFQNSCLDSVFDGWQANYWNVIRHQKMTSSYLFRSCAQSHHQFSIDPGNILQIRQKLIEDLELGGRTQAIFCLQWECFLYKGHILTIWDYPLHTFKFIPDSDMLFPYS